MMRQGTHQPGWHIAQMGQGKISSSFLVHLCQSGKVNIDFVFAFAFSYSLRIFFLKVVLMWDQQRRRILPCGME